MLVQVTGITPSEARAYRDLTGSMGEATVDRGGCDNKVVLTRGIPNSVLLRCLDDHFLKYFGADGEEGRLHQGQDVALLRAAVLRRWLGEFRSRVLSPLRAVFEGGEPETGSAKAIAKRINPLGAPPQIA
jgi:hypothetical protein